MTRLRPAQPPDSTFTLGGSQALPGAPGLPASPRPRAWTFASSTRDLPEGGAALIISHGGIVEAAACLHILSLTLGDPDEYDATLRASEEVLALSRLAGDQQYGQWAYRVAWKPGEVKPILDRVGSR